MGTAVARRRLVVGLGVGALLLFLLLTGLNAFNLRVLDPASVVEKLVFVTLSVLAFLLFVGVLVLLVRNVLKLYADQRSRVLGTRLRTRMLWGAVLVSLVPLVFMFLFSYLLMNRAMDRWFSQPVTQMRDDASNMAFELARYATANARSEADSLAVQLADLPLGPKPTPATLQAVNATLERHVLTLQGGFALIYWNGQPIASVHAPGSGVLLPVQPMLPRRAASQAGRHVAPLGRARSVLDAAQRSDELFYSAGGTDYTLATAGLKANGLVVVGLPVPVGLAENTARLRTAADAYWAMFRERRQIRNLYMGLLLLTTVLALFACCWLALNLSKQVTRPIESLAEAMEAIAAGDYARRVGRTATDELGELAESFNAMATDLESARLTAERSTARLSELNVALEGRRTELETIIETIPNGVVTLDPERRIVLANRAFSEMLDPGGQQRFEGRALAEVLTRGSTEGELPETLDRLLRRSHRMGSAATEMELSGQEGALQVAATASLLEDRSQAHVHLGYVFVLEDLTELMRAQRQSAWKEVARRVAHEIKNPLTPISLNAELIGRHVARLGPMLTDLGVESRSPAVMARSCEVIASSVATMRSLVDQFATLAEFPTARPRPANLNAIVENALATFAGRLGSLRLRRSLAPELPQVLADPEALGRALINLIDNAAEAMSDSLLCELRVSTRLVGPGTLELAVADTGPGVTDEMRERLFLPYFSTKQRGTGLGLSIAAKVVQEHGGTIRVETNQPTGARFIIELRAAGGAEPPFDGEPAAESFAAPRPLQPLGRGGLDS